MTAFVSPFYAWSIEVFVFCLFVTIVSFDLLEVPVLPVHFGEFKVIFYILLFWRSWNPISSSLLEHNGRSTLPVSSGGSEWVKDDLDQYVTGLDIFLLGEWSCSLSAGRMKDRLYLHSPAVRTPPQTWPSLHRPAALPHGLTPNVISYLQPDARHFRVGMFSVGFVLWIWRKQNYLLVWIYEEMRIKSNKDKTGEGVLSWWRQHKIKTNHNDTQRCSELRPFPSHYIFALSRYSDEGLLLLPTKVFNYNVKKFLSLISYLQDPCLVVMIQMSYLQVNWRETLSQNQVQLIRIRR